MNFFKSRTRKCIEERGLRVAVIIPVYGLVEMTRQLVRQIHRESYFVDLFIIDNKGDYTAVASEVVHRTSTNLAWLRGSNLGLSLALEEGPYDAYVLLNNDTNLSKYFFEGMAAAQLSLEPAILLAPVYDDSWPHQRCGYKGPAKKYKGKPIERSVSFVDGTCMWISASSLSRIGFLDEDNFGFYGWGADIDYCVRAREHGIQVYVTERSFLNHARQATADRLDSNYEKDAMETMNRGLTVKYGADLKALVESLGRETGQS